MLPRVENALLIFYIVALSFPFIFGSNGFLMIYYYFKYRNKQVAWHRKEWTEFPTVTIQLPVYNEIYVVNRAIDAICAMDYPKDKLEIQILDDSTDETTSIIAKRVIGEVRRRIRHQARKKRKPAGIQSRRIEVWSCAIQRRIRRDFRRRFYSRERIF